MLCVPPIARHRRHLRRVFAPCTYSLFFIISIVIVLSEKNVFFFHTFQSCDGYSVCILVVHWALDNTSQRRGGKTTTQIRIDRIFGLLITKFSTYRIRIEKDFKTISNRCARTHHFHQKLLCLNWFQIRNTHSPVFGKETKKCRLTFC